MVYENVVSQDMVFSVSGRMPHQGFISSKNPSFVDFIEVSLKGNSIILVLGTAVIQR